MARHRRRNCGGRFRRYSGGTRMAPSGAASRPSSAPSGAAGRLPPCGTDDRRCRSWWLAAQLFIRWSRQGVWERLLELVQQRGVALSMTFIDGTNVRAPTRRPARKKGDRQQRRDLREALGGDLGAAANQGLRDRRRAWPGARLRSLPDRCAELPMAADLLDCLPDRPCRRLYFEPCRVCRRPQLSRGWGYDEEDVEPVFT